MNPGHQFGYRNKHGTIKQKQRLVNQINKDPNDRKYCSAAFLDISQIFDNVWHTRLQVKLKKLSSYPQFELLKYYLADKHFLVKQGNQGFSYGSVLGPVLYLLYAANLQKQEILR